jgi:hypothetical protein
MCVSCPTVNCPNWLTGYVSAPHQQPSPPMGTLAVAFREGWDFQDLILGGCFADGLRGGA